MAITVAPATASPFASAKPIPRDAPVTIAVLPSRENRRDTSNSSAISRFRSAVNAMLKSRTNLPFNPTVCNPLSRT